MNVLFIGNSIPENYCLKIKEASLAGNKFQTKIINELRLSNHCDVVSFIAVPLSTDNKKYLKENSDYNNMYFFKDKFLNGIMNFRNYIKRNINNYDIAIVYNVAYPWINIQGYKKDNKCLLILADFSDSNSYKNPFLKFYSKICLLDIQKYKYVMGLSVKVKRFLNKSQKFICIPGGIDINDYINFKNIKRERKIITLMYSGNLSDVTGVDLLLNAFSNIKNNNVRLIITGRGNLEDLIKKSNDKRIKFYGSVPYDKYLNYLSQADILINPRNMNMPENKNNFPSKIFDYLATGKIVISTKFIGYTNFKKNFIFCDSSETDICNKIKFLINNDNINEIINNTFKKNRRKAVNYSWKNQINQLMLFLK